MQSTIVGSESTGEPATSTFAFMQALEHGLNLDPRLDLSLNSLLVSYILKLLLPSFPLLVVPEKPQLVLFTVMLWGKQLLQARDLLRLS